MEEEKFNLEEIRKSKKYCKYSDVLGVVLESGKNYTLEEADDAIKAFMEKEV